jgi:ribosomal protein S18 acetylase RimI-like enzyme
MVMSILKFLKELMDNSQVIDFSIKDEDENEVGSVQGIIHNDKQRVLNWLQMEKVDRKAYEFIKNMPDDKLLPTAILKNINVDDKYRGKGFGNEGMNQFLDEAIMAKTILLIADSGEIQVGNWDLTKWYQGFGFKVIGSSDISTYPLMMLQQ